MIPLWIAQAILTIVLALLAGLVAALSVPVSLRIRSVAENETRDELTGSGPGDGRSAAAAPPTDAGSVSPGRTVRTEVVWLFGMVRVRLDETSLRRRKRDDGARTRRERRARKKRGSDAPSKTAGRHLPPGGATELISLIRPLLTTLWGIVQRFRVSGHGNLFVGLSDPGDTGRLWGQGYPFFSRISAATGVGIHPAFGGATVRLEGAVTIRTVPIALTFPVLAFLVSRDGRRLVRLVRRSR
jgi:hypothetical protein